MNDKTFNIIFDRLTAVKTPFKSYMIDATKFEEFTPIQPIEETEEELSESDPEEEQLKPPTQPTEVKEGVQDIFNSNPELASIGTPEQYSQYLDTIFPDSKVKDIVYHATKDKDKILKEGFDKNYLSSRTGTSNEFWDPTGELQKRNKLGFYFAKNGKSVLLSVQGFAERLSNAEIQNSLLSVVLNFKNPQSIDTLETSKVQEGYDSIISTEEFHIPDNAGGIDYTDIIYVAPEPEQIHILGSKQDIEGFKKFVTQPAAQPTGETDLSIEAKKANLKRQIEALPDNMIYGSHVTQDDVAKDIYDSQFNFNLGTSLSGTVGLTNKQGLLDLMNNLLDGKSPHRNQFGVFILAFPKSEFGETSAERRVNLETIENDMLDNYPEFAQGKIPTKFNFGYFKDGVLVTGTNLPPAGTQLNMFDNFDESNEQLRKQQEEDERREDEEDNNCTNSPFLD
jgi:hypothetical protein